MELQFNLQVSGKVEVNSTILNTELTVTEGGQMQHLSLSAEKYAFISDSVREAIFGRHTPVNPPANPPATGMGTFTYKVHMDLNGDGLQNLDEPDGNIPAGTMLVIASRAGAPVINIDLSGTGPTAGRVDHYALPVGDYDMHVTLPAGYHTLGVPDQVIHITADADVNMGFLGLIAD
jgi:hypothetical protein